MGMLGRAIGEGLNLGATELTKDYERQGDLSAKKDLASYEGEIRQRLADRQNEWQGGQNLQRQTFEGELQSKRLQSDSDLQGKRLTSEETRAIDRNALEYQLKQDELTQRAKEHGMSYGLGKAQLDLAKKQFAHLVEHADLPEGVRTASAGTLKILDEKIKEMRDPMLPPEQKKILADEVMALQDSHSKMLQPYISKNAPKPPLVSPNDSDMEMSRLNRRTAPPDSSPSPAPAPAKQATGGMLSRILNPSYDTPLTGDIANAIKPKPFDPTLFDQ